MPQSQLSKTFSLEEWISIIWGPVVISDNFQPPLGDCQAYALYPASLPVGCPRHHHQFPHLTSHGSDDPGADSSAGWMLPFLTCSGLGVGHTQPDGRLTLVKGGHWPTRSVHMFLMMNLDPS